MAKGDDSPIIWLLCCVVFIEGCDQQLLPACMHALEVDFGLSPQGLAAMSLAQGLFMSASTPFWALLVDRFERQKLLASTCLAWGCLTLLLAASRSVIVTWCLRCLHGIAMSPMGPISQSIIGDVFEPQGRGAAFGMLNTSNAVGRLLVTYVGIPISDKTILGLSGWRILFFLVAVLAFVSSAILTCKFPKLPRQTKPRLAWEQCARVRDMWKIPTFKVLVMQGFFGCIACNAITFMPMFLMYSGHSPNEVAFAMLINGIFAALSPVMGGHLGDRLGKISQGHGRPIIAQISCFVWMASMPIIVSTASGSSLWSCLFWMCVGSLCSGWVTPGVKLPILTEIVGAQDQAISVALLMGLEGSVGALIGTPLVAYLSQQVFGYIPVNGVADQARLSEHNSKALGDALVWSICPVLMIQFLVFLRLHWTYLSDAEKHENEIYLLGPVVDEPFSDCELERV